MRVRVIVVVSLSLLLASFAVVPARAQLGQEKDLVRVVPVSNRADLVSGGDVLIEIVVPERADHESIAVEVDGRDVTDSISVTDDGRIYGLIDGLEVGANRITVTLPDGSGAHLDVTNHPIGGPIFSGPQVQPWICTTGASGLGAAHDEQCNASTAYDFRYKSSLTGLFAPYDPDNPPSDVATTTTDEGHEVPYVIRVERGTINRGIYELAMLFDPAQPWEPWAPQEQWNNKLYWNFGGDCTPNHVQPVPDDELLPTDTDTILLATALHDQALSRGFISATSGMTILGRNCNDVVSAETVMMVKEHIVERYGELRYTMSQGASGGSMQQHWIAANYPGLLDGIQPIASYPDIWETMQAAEDCHLLDRVFDQQSPHLWLNPLQQAAAAGHATVGTCRTLWDGPGGYAQTWLDPSNAAGCGLDPSLVYRPDANPGGVRCTLQDYQGALWGQRDRSAWTQAEQAIGQGFANRPFDNVGVQYGLAALDSGAILPEQFVDLNEHIGGLDIDWQWQTERSVADPAALERAYLGGRITHGGQLASVPIVDYRGTSNLEIHTDVHTWVTRARLVAANGHADNHMHWNSICPLVPCLPIQDEAFRLLDRWLSAIDADERDVPQEQKVVDNRPADAVDACWVGPTKVTDQEICRAVLPFFATPRLTAGAPMTDDVLKCQLKTLDRADYAVTFTDDQWQRLEAAFPDGVCDYGRQGVGQQPPSGPWQTYASGPDGRPLGSASASVPFGPARAPGPTGEGEGSGGPLPATGGGLPALALAAVALAFAHVPRGRRKEGRP